MSSRTGNPGSGNNTPLNNPVLIGTTIVVALMVGVFLSYNANKGLPFVKTFPLNAKVADAAELVKGSEVRIGGFRVGQVVNIVAEPAKGDQKPYARLEMKLDGSFSSIPADTIVRVRPRSLLGAKYVELQPGDGDEEVKADATLPLENSRPTAELDEIFNTFDADTRQGLQGTLRNFGDAVAGRGSDINRALVATNQLLPPLQRVVKLLASPETDLDGFVEGAAQFTSALAPVADDLGKLFDNGAITLAAIDAAGDSLGRTLDELPPTEEVGLRALNHVSPVLHDLADLTVGLREGTRELPRTTDQLTAALNSGTRVLRRTELLTDPLNDTLKTLDIVARDKATDGAIRKLTEALPILQPTLDLMLASQKECNTLALALRNQASAVSRGDTLGTWLTFLPIIELSEASRATTPTEGLHFNPYPIMNATECEAGNEPFTPPTQLGNPPSTEPSETEDTLPPADVTSRARAAGLLDHIPGATR